MSLPVNSVAQQKYNQAEKCISFSEFTQSIICLNLLSQECLQKRQNTKEEMGLHDQVGGWVESAGISKKKQKKPEAVHFLWLVSKLWL